MEKNTKKNRLNNGILEKKNSGIPFRFRV